MVANTSTRIQPRGITRVADLGIPPDAWVIIAQYAEVRDIVAVTSTCHYAMRMLRGAYLLSPSVTYRGIDGWVQRTGVKLTSPKEFRVKRAAQRSISRLCYAADGTRRLVMAVEELQQSLEVWNLDSMTCEHLDSDFAFVHAIVAVRGQPRVISAVDSGRGLTIHNLNTLCTEFSLHFSGERFAAALCMDVDGHLLTGSADDGVIRVWDISTGECVSDKMKPEEGSPVRALALLESGLVVSLQSVECFSPNDIRVWNPRTEALVATIPVRGHCLCVCPLEGSSFAVGHGVHDHSISIFAASSSTPPSSTDTADPIISYQRLATLTGHISPVVALQRIGDSKLVSCGNDQTLRVWDLRSGRSTRRLRRNVKALASPSQDLDPSSCDLTYSCYEGGSGSSHEIHFMQIH